MKEQINKRDIAIIGLSAKFSASPDVTTFWQNLKEGKELTTTYSKEELADLGVSSQLSAHPDFVAVDGRMKGTDQFDADFFGYSREEAAVMDPQIRLFHQLVWSALEDAAYDPQTFQGKIGLFATASDNLLWRTYTRLMANENVNPFFANLISNKNFISLLPAFKLNLRGPSFFLDTACSSSLVAFHQACRSLMLRECHMAMAGGVRVSMDKSAGYLYEEGMIFSQDGHCRTFDERATGTVEGEGGGVVVLKRLSEAIADGDHIYAIVKATAINNDGKHKVGFTAPSVSGQSSCIRLAYRMAGVDPATVSYVEAHGTGTKLGDPIEIGALNKVFAGSSPKSCAIGSVKSNMGHLDTAAGIAGLIKTVLCLHHKTLPPSINFTKANPEIDFEGGPFFVNDQLREWTAEEGVPLRAGVSSFGLGGTNAHVVLQEAPSQEQTKDQEASPNTLVVSAKSKAALQRQLKKLNAFLSDRPNTSLSDLAYTMQTGRASFPHRSALAFQGYDQLMKALSSVEQSVHSSLAPLSEPSVVFLFSGAGTQYIDMGQQLYEVYPVFRDAMDKGFELLQKLTGTDYRAIVYPTSKEDRRINEMLYTQPVIFLFEYAIAQLLMQYGPKPTYMIGHSLGEYVAACLSGVFSFEDALQLVVGRGELMNRMPKGAMLSVQMTEAQAAAYVSDDIAIAAINGPEQIVLSGAVEAIDSLEQQLEENEMPFVRLHASIAAHSHMIDPLLKDFQKQLSEVTFHKPQIPFIASPTGQLIAEEQACSIEYWLQHMRQTVRFSNGIDHLLGKKEKLVFVEVGSSNSLSILLQNRTTTQGRIEAVNLVRHPKEKIDDQWYWLSKLGQLWTKGVNIDWSVLWGENKGKRISLPTYDFEPTIFPSRVDVSSLLQSKMPGLAAATAHEDIREYLYQTIWKTSPHLSAGEDLSGQEILLLSSGGLLEKHLVAFFRSQNASCTLVSWGEKYEQKEQNHYAIRADREEEVEQLFDSLKKRNWMPDRIIHSWCATEQSEQTPQLPQKALHESLLYIVKVFATQCPDKTCRLELLGRELYKVVGTDVVQPAKALILGMAKVVRREFEKIRLRIIDLSNLEEANIHLLCKELRDPSDASEVAIRHATRYQKAYEQIEWNTSFPSASRLKKQAVYLLTGASGGMGQIFAKHFAQEYQAKLILMGRRSMDEAQLQSLRDQGAEVLYLQIDLQDVAGVRDSIRAAEEQMGPIRGVVHMAGEGDQIGMIMRRDAQKEEKVLIPKVTGTHTLHQYFKDKPLDFFVNCSSVAAEVGPFGLSAYGAANLYQNAFADAVAEDFPMISISWGQLRNIGMSSGILQGLTEEQKAYYRNSGIKGEELWPLLQLALQLKRPNLLISARSFTEYMKTYQKHLTEYIREESEEQPEAIEKMTVNRSGLSSEYVEPQSELERQIADIWEAFLGLENIGLQDNFFELGGDSLKAMVVLKKIQKKFNIRLTLKLFFDNPTIHFISQSIEELQTILAPESGQKKLSMRI